MAQENLKSYLTGISHSVASMLAASSQVTRGQVREVNPESWTQLNGSQ